MAYCKDCKWWDPLSYGGDPKRPCTDEEIGARKGWCCRKAPDGSNKNKWPEVFEGSACGEFDSSRPIGWLLSNYAYMKEENGRLWRFRTNNAKKIARLKRKIVKLEKQLAETTDEKQN